MSQMSCLIFFLTQTQTPPWSASKWAANTLVSMPCCSATLWTARMQTERIPYPLQTQNATLDRFKASRLTTLVST